MSLRGNISAPNTPTVQKVEGTAVRQLGFRGRDERQASWMAGPSVAMRKSPDRFCLSGLLAMLWTAGTGPPGSLEAEGARVESVPRESVPDSPRLWHP